MNDRYTEEWLTNYQTKRGLRLEWVCSLDGYEPRLAEIVTETISEQSDLTLSVMMKFMADMAREEMSLN